MRKCCLLGVLIVFSFTKGNGQDVECLFNYLSGFDSLSITLTYPFDSLYKTRQEEIEGTIDISSERGDIFVDEPIKLDLRGKFRRMNCVMPPLMLNFRKSTLKDMGLNDHDDIKLVTHCLDTEEGEENLLEERLCYLLYESLTPYSYRTTWVTIRYQDTNDSAVFIDSKGFLIEPDKDLEDRLSVEETKRYNPPEDSIDFESYSFTAAFNFLIGNRDWSVVMARNAKLFYDADKGKYVVIPYDFDYCNIVGASYRKMVLWEGLKHPKDRVYFGEYFSDRAAEILQTFAKTENGILHRIMVSPGNLSEKHRKKIRTYCETWYKYIETRKTKDLAFEMVMPYKGGL